MAEPHGGRAEAHTADTGDPALWSHEHFDVRVLSRWPVLGFWRHLSSLEPTSNSKGGGQWLYT